MFAGFGLKRWGFKRDRCGDSERWGWKIGMGQKMSKIDRLISTVDRHQTLWFLIYPLEICAWSCHFGMRWVTFFDSTISGCAKMKKVYLAAVLVVMFWWVHLRKFSGVGQGLKDLTPLTLWRHLSCTVKKRKRFSSLLKCGFCGCGSFCLFHHFPRILMDPIFRHFNRRKLVSHRSYSWCWAALTCWRRGKVAETETIRFSMWVCLI